MEPRTTIGVEAALFGVYKPARFWLHSGEQEVRQAPRIELGTDYDTARLRALAKAIRDTGQSRRLLALA
jgi:hypothetical protein